MKVEINGEGRQLEGQVTIAALLELLGVNGGPVAVPVVLVPRQDVTVDDAALFEQIESSVHQWLDAAQPPATEARLSFGITIWSTIAAIEVPLLRIADASLPMSAIVKE